MNHVTVCIVIIIPHITMKTEWKYHRWFGMKPISTYSSFCYVTAWKPKCLSVQNGISNAWNLRSKTNIFHNL